MRSKLCLLLFFFLLVFCSKTFGQDNQLEVSLVGRTADKFFNIDFRKPIRLDTFVWDLFDSTATPAGISFAKDEDVYSEKYEFRPSTPKLGDILDSFAQATGYSWRESNGVVNIFPAQDYSILDTQISRFVADKEYPSDLRKKLIETPEFQKYLHDRNLIDRVPDPMNKHGFITIGPIGRPDPRSKISFELTNASVREILNEIVRKRANGLWSYREYDLVDDNDSYSMYRLEL